MDLVVRDVEPNDAAAVVAVLNPIIQSGLYAVFDAPFTEEEERRYITGLPPRGIFHVAIRLADGLLVGFQSLEPFATFTHAFDHVGVMGTYVGLAYRGQGIADRLFVATFEAARHKGYEKLFTYIREDNPSALAAYVKHGFRVVGKAERQAKIGGRYVDEIFVERFL
jgi:L-amino acid N-acyltransferase YncA